MSAVLLGRPGGAELPIVTGMDFGHTAPFFSLPYGALAEIDCDARTFAVVEPACSPREPA